MIASHSRSLTRRDSKARLTMANSYVVELVRRVSAAGLGGAADTVAYANLLDRVLEDRTVTVAEVEGLHEMALSLGMTAEQVFDAHWRYVEALASMALSDASISDHELADLRHVGALLGLEFETTEGIVEACAASEERASTCRPWKSLDGCSVCFTGQLARTVGGLPIERAQAEAIARSAGLTVKSGVSKKLDVLVCADPDSCSVKARRARDYGVRIMAEQAFWRALSK